MTEVVDLLSYCNFMNIPSLFELCCAKIASYFKGRTFDQVKKDFELPDVTLTALDEESVLQRFPWMIAETQKVLAKLENPVPIINKS